MPLLPALVDANATLLIVDMQKGLDESDYYGGNRNNPDAEKNAALLLAAWRKESLPVFHVQHSSLNPKSPLFPSSPGFDWKNEVYPQENEAVIIKSVNSAFIGTDLYDQLTQKKITHLVIIGFTTNHCVSSTVRSAANLGFHTTVISDATATFDRTGTDGTTYDSGLIHDITLTSLNEEFAIIKSVADLFQR